MIVLWKPPRINEQDWQLACRAWGHYAERRGQPLITHDWIAFKRCAEWDKLNEHDSSTVIWALPHFIPAPSLNDELAVLSAEGYRIVVPRRYTAVFSQGAPRPVLWQPDGVSPALVVVLPRAQHWRLPAIAKIHDIDEWLDSEHPKVFRAEGHWADNRVKSILGTVFPDLWGGGELGVAGRQVSGNTYWYDKAQLLQAWREAVEGWWTWEKRKS